MEMSVGERVYSIPLLIRNRARLSGFFTAGCFCYLLLPRFCKRSINRNFPPSEEPDFFLPFRQRCQGILFKGYNQQYFRFFLGYHANKKLLLNIATHAPSIQPVHSFQKVSAAFSLCFHLSVSKEFTTNNNTHCRRKDMGASVCLMLAL